MAVPLLDLKAQYITLKTELDAALIRVAESQNFILGKEVETLEQSLCSYLGVKHAFGVSSGTDALLIALMALDIKTGDEVIVPTYSFFATAGAVVRLGATPIFVDIDPVTFNIDPETIENAITDRTKAIIPVHLFGQSADMKPIMDIASKYNLAVVEDAAQAIGAEYFDGKKSGTIGHIGCYSFFPSKNLGCFGDGGLVVTNDDELAENLKILRVHGGKPKYYHKVIGGNFRLDAIQAAVINVKLPYLDGWSAKRRENAETYYNLFLESSSKIEMPKPVYKESGVTNYHIYNQFVIMVDDRAKAMAHLKENGIGCEIYYPVPFHKQECFAYLNQPKHFPKADFAAEHSFAIPIFPELNLEQLNTVVNTLKGI